MTPTKRIKFFILSLALSILFWWGVNLFHQNLKEIIFANEILTSPQHFYLAEISTKYHQLYHPQLKDIKITAQSALSVEISPTGKERVVFSKNPKEKLPIASLSKLMTAIIAQEFYKPNLFVKVSKKAISQPENIGKLNVGEILRVKDLLQIMLIESSNDAAYSLSELIGTEGFVDLMNLKAKALGMNDTQFFEPTGLDSEDTQLPDNYSTVSDLVKLSEYLIKKHPEILKITSFKQYPLFDYKGRLHHILHNTNELLGERKEIIGGKTGYTKKAGGCLLIISKGKTKGSFLITVVLNSKQRFEDIRKILNFYYGDSTHSNN